MQRDIKKLSSTKYDLLVIGGGITGACVAWDAALRGLKVAMVDKSDFGAATSAATSKLIHGGMRYLKTFEFDIVRESLRERRTMEAIVPHQVYPWPYVFPAYGWTTQGFGPAMAAMVLFQSFAFDRKWINDEDKKVPGFSVFPTKKSVLKASPYLDQKDLKGGVQFYDCQMHSPERVTLEFVLSAAEFGADVANYVKVDDLKMNGSTVEGVKATDLLSGEAFEIDAAVTLNAAGPWADLMLGNLKGAQQKNMIRSKGIHIITRDVTGGKSVVLRTPDGRHFMALSWRGHSLIGTTDEKFEGAPDDFKVTESDIQGLIRDINACMPSANINRDDVLWFYGGLRPIVEQDTSVEVEVYDASRKYEVYDHAKDDNINGFITVIGGKYTTSRHLAENLVDLTYEKLGKPSPKCETASTPVFGGEMGRFKSFVQRAQKTGVKGLDDASIANLCQNYGSHYMDVVNLADSKNKGLEKVCDQMPDIVAELIYAVRVEMAQTLVDVLFRRTGLGTLGLLDEKVLKNIADIVGNELGWDAKRKKEEIAKVKEQYIPLEG